MDLGELRAALGAFRQEVGKAFSEFDVVVAPTLPTLPIRISDAEASFALGYCTFESNVGGLPSISVPCGSPPMASDRATDQWSPVCGFPCTGVAGAYEAASGRRARS